MKAVFKKYFITGLLIIVPVAVTWLILLRLISWLHGKLDFHILPDSLPAGQLEYFPDFAIRAINALLATADFILTLVIVLLAIISIGMIARALVVRRLISFGERLLARVPLAGIIYRASKQLMEAVFSPGMNHFDRVVLVEYPRRGAWSLAFVSSNAAPILNKTAGMEMLCIFMPTTPNPTTGFLFMVAKEEVRDVPLSIEEAFKMIISAGVFQPSDKQSRGEIRKLPATGSEENSAKEEL